MRCCTTTGEVNDVVYHNDHVQGPMADVVGAEDETAGGAELALVEAVHSLQAKATNPTHPGARIPFHCLRGQHLRTLAGEHEGEGSLW